MASNIESGVLSDSESESENSVNQRSIKMNVETSVHPDAQSTSTICRVPSVDLLYPSQGVIRETHNLGRQAFPAIHPNPGINSHSLITNESAPSEDIDRSIRWSHVDKGGRCNTVITQDYKYQNY